VTAQGILLRLADDPNAADLDAWSAALSGLDGGHVLTHGAETYGFAAAVVVRGHARDRPAPSALRRLVDAALRSPGRVVTARTIPLDESARLEAVAGTETVATPLAEPSAVVFHDPRPARHDFSDPPPPTGHPAALPATSVATLLAAIGIEPPRTPLQHTGPFLTVVTRTRGTRPQCLEETLLSLTAQTQRDFEVVLACHRTTPADLARTHRLVEAQPRWLRHRIRILEVSRPGRSAPLNDALADAHGRYCVVLDDDDVVNADWVATFLALERAAPGTVLRCLAVRQDVAPVVVETCDGPVSCPLPTDAPVAQWPPRFSIVDHLHGNYSPCMTVAFPRGLVRELGMRYDEALETTEDWDFLVRAAALVGVIDSGTVTAVYRWWTQGSSSRHEHSEAAWRAHHDAVQGGFDRLSLILPPGSAADVRRVFAERDEARVELDKALVARDEMERAFHEAVRSGQEAVAAHDSAVAAHDEAVAAHDRVIEVLHEREADLAMARGKMAELRERIRALKANLRKDP
jgi:hypothetical protein